MLVSKSMLPQSTCNSIKSVHKTKVANLKRSKSIILILCFLLQPVYRLKTRSDTVKTAINRDIISKDGPFVLSLKRNYSLR